ncbi:S16 family serine protease [Engelhardtia mirabilis]|uniref:endopeptidase La n=1 Tax=Engelhardtia mirabilis TaxID=2528011 RepID=A0A518BIZ1_9BACT|nr:Lon protease [Planctomycetes bacterium Pla133]QDV01275.1 Lon protease [Planctomycetes bacterium Pla86]
MSDRLEDDSQLLPLGPLEGVLDRSKRGSRVDTGARLTDHLQERLASCNLPSGHRAALSRELAQLADLPPTSATAGRLIGWIDWVLSLPWPGGPGDGSTGTPEGRDLPDLDRIAGHLAETHAGCDEVVQRVLESLAVAKLGGTGRGDALLFVGPPGTGKSSLARALARAMERPFVNLATGAMTDDYQLGGVSHRQEGAFPGAILEGLRRAGRADAVILLDELDKLQLGGGGDAGGPLLELLDSDLRSEFLDQYLGLPFDLSRCLLIATANDHEEMPEALIDRFDVIEFWGYTERAKVEIARRHLLPRARSRAGIDAPSLTPTPAAVRAIIREHTEEAGVRQLGRRLDTLARKAAAEVLRGGSGLRVRRSDVRTLLGPALVESEVRARRPRIGVALGLAYTSTGGALLPIEALAMPGSGRTILTGQVGEVMRESFQTALSWGRTRLGSLKLAANHLDELDLHLHFPASAIPKDGPSAGAAIVVALYSLLSRRAARHDLALTGEVSLHGAVLPVGGLREKLLAAARAGVREVVVPRRNAEELMRLPSEVREPLVIHLVSRIDEVLELALLPRRGRGSGRSPGPRPGADEGGSKPRAARGRPGPR